MTGIISYGAHVPANRLPLGALGGRRPKEGGPEKAVAWNDEDSVTMAVSAAVNCLRGFDRSQIDALYFASTTHPFKEKQGAALIARALDLPRNLQAADFSSSTRAGTAALRAAADAVAAGSAKRVLVVASDCRMGAPNSGLERNSGDGAAAFLIGDGEVIASIEGFHSVADEILDVWRGEGEAFVHSWEDRFVVQEGYLPRMAEAAKGLLDEAGLAAADVTRVLLYAPDARSHATAARTLGLTKEQIGAPLFGRLGNAGAAFAPLQLIGALEDAKPGDRLLVVNYGDGADAVALSVADPIEKLEERRGLAWNLARRRPVKDYDSYLRARGLNTSEWQTAPAPGLSATVHHRERDDDVSFLGQKCGKCAAVQFPFQRVCETCFSKDDFEPVRLSDKIGKVITYTFDYFFPTPNPPTVVSITEVEGARIHLQIVNVDPKDVKLGMPVEFEFRRIHEGGGRPNYYWKGVPAAE